MRNACLLGALLSIVLCFPLGCTKGSGTGGGQTTTKPAERKFAGPFAVDEGGARVYWAVYEGIRSATLEGADERPFIRDLERKPTCLHVDAAAKRLVWSDSFRVFSAGLDGGALQDLGEGRHVDVSSDGKAVYVARAGGGIYKLSGGTAELVAQAADEVRDLAVADALGKLFWIQDVGVYEAAIGGGAPTLLAGSEELKGSQLDLDPEQSSLYVRDGQRTHRMALAGGPPLRVLGEVREPSYIDVVSGSRVYWSSTEYQELWSADLTSDAEKVLQEAEGGIDDFTIHEAGQRLYWLSMAGIRVADLDGQNPQQAVAGIDGKIEHVRVDASGNKAYVRTATSLSRVNLDGTGFETLLSELQDGSSFVGGISVGADIIVDSASQKLYWTKEDETNTSQHVIVRGNLDGSGAQQLPGIALNSHSPLDLDSTGGKLYFRAKTGIARSNLDGSGLETLPITGLSSVVGLRVDAASGKLYLLEPQQLSRSDLDGQNLEVVLDLPVKANGLSFDASAGHLYYQTAGNLFRVDVSAPAPAPTQVTLPTELSVATSSFTVEGGEIYLGTNAGHVARFGVAAPDPLEIVAFRVSSPVGIAVVGDTLYWADRNAKWIAASDLDGKNARMVLAAAVDDDLKADPAGGGLYFSSEQGLYRLSLDTGEAEQVFSQNAGSLTPTSDALFYIPLNSYGIPTNTPSVTMWRDGDSTQLIDDDLWVGGEPRTLAWGATQLYCLDSLGILSMFSGDTLANQLVSIIPTGISASRRAAYFQAPTKTLYFAKGPSIYRYVVPDGPRVRMHFALN